MSEQTFLDTRRGATFSECGLYRYRLWRTWDTGLPTLNVIGLNPSTADAVQDDPTIRRCIGFARDWGYGSLVMTNLFAFRATDPREMKRFMAPIGQENDRHLVEVAEKAGLVLAAWGVHGDHMGRADAVIDGVLRGIQVHCLGRTAGNYPRHPLYLPKTTKPEVYQ